MLSRVAKLASLASSVDLEDRRRAFRQIQQLSGIEFLLFAREVGSLRGWGSGLQKAISKWYAQFTPEELALALRGFEEEHVWVLKRAHVRPASEAHSELFAELIKLIAEVSVNDPSLNRSESLEAAR